MKSHTFFFQQDNNLKHTAKMIKIWFKENDVDLLSWLPNSQDLNIITKLWDHLDCKIWAQRLLLHTEDELWEALQEEWCATNVKLNNKLYKSMPDKLHAVYNAHGGSTHH